jgi:type IV pilus assembly protein PilQ
MCFTTGCAPKRINVSPLATAPADIAAKLSASTLPTKPVPTLTREQIQTLETVESSEVERKYLDFAEKENKRLKTQPTVSNVFVESDLRQVLLDIATQAKTNIIMDETVQGTVSASFEKVPLESALSQVLAVGGYKFRLVTEGENRFYLVGKAIPENPSFDRLSVTRVIKTNQEAAKVVEQISEYYKPYILPSKDGNSLTLTGPPDVLDRLELDIAMIDRVKRQIEISARFAFVQWEKGTNLGMQWGDIDLNAAGLGNFLKGAVPGFTGNTAVAISNVLQINGMRAKVDIIAEPRLIIEDGGKGEIKITRDDIFLLLSGGGSYYNYYTTKETTTGVILDVQPFVSRDGMLRLVLHPEISDIIGQRQFSTGSGSSSTSETLPIVARRGETTTLRVENGKTIAIGGLLMHEKSETKSGIPGLSDVPLLGTTVFGGTQSSQTDSELVIFITSRIIG